MVIEWSVMAGLIGACGWLAATLVSKQKQLESAKKMLQDAGEDVEKLHAFIRKNNDITIERLQNAWKERDEIARAERHRADREIEKWKNQNQAMAEKMATIKVQAAEEGVILAEDPVPFDSDPPKPYDPELWEFLNAIEQDEAKKQTEEYIERRRDQGAADIQILSELDSGEYA